MNDIKSSAPVGNKFNAIDFYLTICIIHVFAAIIEYAILLLLMKSRQTKEDGKTTLAINQNVHPNIVQVLPTPEKTMKNGKIAIF